MSSNKLDEVRDLISEEKYHESIVILNDLVANEEEPILESLTLLGKVNLKIKNFEKSEIAFEKAFNIGKEYEIIRSNLLTFYAIYAEELKKKKDYILAIKYHDKLISLDKKNAYIHFCNKGANYKFNNDIKNAKQCYETSIKLKENYIVAYLNLYEALKEEGEFEYGKKNLEKLIEVKNNEPKAYVDELSKKVIKKAYNSLLAMYYNLDNYSSYKKLLNEIIEYDKGITSVAAIDTFVSNQLEITAEYPFCKDPLYFLKNYNLYDDRSLDNKLDSKKLYDEINTHTFYRDETGKATKGGRQTNSNLFQSPKEDIRRLRSKIIEKIENYKHFYSNEDDFIIKGWPNKTRFTAWSVIYEQGHQISHNHPDGWISGVFYLKVPDDLLDNEGSIEFSIHGYDHKIIHNNFENYTYKPKEGDLLLFPSSLYHKTIPYQSKKDRVVVAFDLCPA